MTDTPLTPERVNTFINQSSNSDEAKLALCGRVIAAKIPDFVWSEEAVVTMFKVSIALLKGSPSNHVAHQILSVIFHLWATKVDRKHDKIREKIIYLILPRAETLGFALAVLRKLHDDNARLVIKVLLDYGYRLPIQLLDEVFPWFFEPLGFSPKNDCVRERRVNVTFDQMLEPAEYKNLTPRQIYDSIVKSLSPEIEEKFKKKLLEYEAKNNNDASGSSSPGQAPAPTQPPPPSPPIEEAFRESSEEVEGAHQNPITISSSPSVSTGRRRTRHTPPVAPFPTGSVATIIENEPDGTEGPDVDYQQQEEAPDDVDLIDPRLFTTPPPQSRQETDESDDQGSFRGTRLQEHDSESPLLPFRSLGQLYSQVIQNEPQTARGRTTAYRSSSVTQVSASSLLEQGHQRQQPFVAPHQGAHVDQQPYEARGIPGVADLDAVEGDRSTSQVASANQSRREAHLRHRGTQTAHGHRGTQTAHGHRGTQIPSPRPAAPTAASRQADPTAHGHQTSSGRQADKGSGTKPPFNFANYQTSSNHQASSMSSFGPRDYFTRAQGSPTGMERVSVEGASIMATTPQPFEAMGAAGVAGSRRNLKRGSPEDDEKQAKKKKAKKKGDSDVDEEEDTDVDSNDELKPVIKKLVKESIMELLQETFKKLTKKEEDSDVDIDDE